MNLRKIGGWGGAKIFEDISYPSATPIDANSWKGPLFRNIHNESFRLPLPVKIHFRVRAKSIENHFNRSKNNLHLEPSINSFRVPA